jgi:hypothetical protein
VPNVLRDAREGGETRRIAEATLHSTTVPQLGAGANARDRAVCICLKPWYDVRPLETGSRARKRGLLATPRGRACVKVWLNELFSLPLPSEELGALGLGVQIAAACASPGRGSLRYILS